VSSPKFLIGSSWYIWRKAVVQQEYHACEALAGLPCSDDHPDLMMSLSRECGGRLVRCGAWASFCVAGNGILIIRARPTLLTSLRALYSSIVLPVQTFITHLVEFC
jgi:hypothetical protein